MARQKNTLATLESATKFMDRDYMIVNYIDEKWNSKTIS